MPPSGTAVQEMGAYDTGAPDGDGSGLLVNSYANDDNIDDQTQADGWNAQEAERRRQAFVQNLSMKAVVDPVLNFCFAQTVSDKWKR